MAIQWFPGHMHKARKEISEAMSINDIVIEILDARLPFSSENPLMDRLRRTKPCLKILNKSDLADPKVTALWLEHLNAKEGVQAIALTTEHVEAVKRIPLHCRDLLRELGRKPEYLRAIIVGIPNVGKSTLINILKGRRVAKVGNEPAVTKRHQRIDISNEFTLCDTPGILWPRIDYEDSGYRLAASGAIKDTVVDYYDVALYGADMLLARYPELLMERYKLKELPSDSDAVIEAIGRKRGCLRKGRGVDLHKAAEILIHELRSGRIGCVSLETPAEVAEMMVAHEAKVKLVEAAEAAANAGSN